MTDVVANIIVCHNCKQRDGANCAKSGKPFAQHAEHHSCPDARFKSRGIGDALEKIIHWTGADKVVSAIAGKPCEPEEGQTLSPCQKRRDRLNTLLQNEGSD